MLSLAFDRGTILLHGLEEAGLGSLAISDARFDHRVGAVRLPAYRYAQLILGLRARGVAYDDKARAYARLQDLERPPREPRPYQAEALAAWKSAGRRGVVVLPTGAG